jgi:hypothetical protein
MNEFLSEMIRLKTERKTTQSILVSDGAAQQLVEEIRSLRGTLDQGRTTEVERWIKAHRELWTYATMRNPDFMDGTDHRYKNKAGLSFFLTRIEYVALHLQQALEDFTYAEKMEEAGNQASYRTSFNSGVTEYKEALRYLDPSVWRGLAGGRGPLTAMGQLYMEAAHHLASDAIGAHCRVRDFRQPDVCQSLVSSNHWSYQPTHTDADDRLFQNLGTAGRWLGWWRPGNNYAIRASEDIFWITLEDDPLRAERDKLRFLDRYWPDTPTP